MNSISSYSLRGHLSLLMRLDIISWLELGFSFSLVALLLEVDFLRIQYNAGMLGNVFLVIRGLFYVGQRYLLFILVFLAYIHCISSAQYMSVLIIQIKAILPFWFLLSYFIIVYLLSATGGIATVKVMVGVQYVIPVLVAGFFLSIYSDMQWLFIGFQLMAVLLCLFVVGDALGLINFQRNELIFGGRLIGNSDPITTGNNLLICSVAIIISLLSEKRKMPFRVMQVGLLCILIYGALLAGSKGPFVAFIASCLFIAIKMKYARIKTILMLLAMTVLIKILFNYIEYISPASFKHLLMLDEFRQYYYALAIEQVPSFWGYGIGSFARFVGVNELGLGYVHNLWLDIYLEAGIFGVILFCWLLFYWVRSQRRFKNISNRPEVLFVDTAAFYYFIAAQFSGHVFSASGFWGFLLLGLWMSVREGIGGSNSFKLRQGKYAKHRQ